MLKFVVPLLVSISAYAEPFTFYSDNHVGARVDGFSISTLPYSRNQVLDENAYDLGDTVEMKNCNDVRAQTSLQNNMRRFFAGRYVSGNHNSDASRDLVVNGHILLMHGDIVWYPLNEKIRTYGVCKGKGTFDKVGPVPHPGTLLPTYKETIYAHAQNFPGVDTVVMGHLHPQTMVDETYQGLRIIVVPRGRTSIDLD